MRYVLTQSTEHLPLPRVKVERKNFPDGELYIRVGPVQKVVLLTNITANNLLEVLFTADAVRHAGGKIQKITIPYLGYARQDKVYKKGEAFSAAVICQVIKRLGAPVEIYDVHNEEIRKHLPFKSLSLLPELLKKVPEKDYVIISPDQGGRKRAAMIAKMLKAPLAVLKKTKVKGRVEVEGKVVVRGRDVLIVEDMISTGSTLERAAEFLQEAGAKTITVIAAHAVFTKGARSRLEKGPIKKIYVSNSFDVKPSKKIEVVACLER